MKKRLTCLAMALLLCLQLLPLGVFAAVDPDTNLCEHHTAHDTAVCGYVEGVEGAACGHTHDKTACYTQGDCTHTHEAACYPATESGEPGTEPAACTHVCSVESGCYTLTCPHTAHDDACGYVEAVTAVSCGYVCQDCASQPEVTYLVYTTLNDANGGTVSGEGSYAPGEEVTVSIVPNTDGGYCAAQWGLFDLGEGVIPAINRKTSHTFKMPEQNVQISISFVQHSFATSYRDLGDGTHQNICTYCQLSNGAPEAHVDKTGAGDSQEPNGVCDKCSADMPTDPTPTTYTVTFDGNGSAGGSTAAISTEGEFTFPANGFTAPTGKEFAGWSDVNNATEADAPYQPGDTYAVEGDTTFYAIWKDHIHKYGPVNYDAASHWFECSCGAKAVETAHSYEYECTAKCSDCDYERLATHVYIDGDAWLWDHNMHALFCKYCSIESILRPHEYDNACDAKCDVCHFLRNAAPHNYEWLLNAEGHEEKCSACGDARVARAAHTSSGAATNDTPETCCVCGYEIAPKLESTLTIIYDDKAIGGVLAYAPGNARYKFPTGTVVDLSDYWPDTRKYTVDGEEYTFWNFTPNAGHGNILTSVTLNQDTTVYACWVTTGNMHTITFDATGGSVVPKKIVDRNLWLVNDNVPIRLGYEFLGWSLENDGTPDDFWVYDLTSDCTLYATWKQIHNVSPNWSYDADVHYHTCDCGERHDEEKHIFYINSHGCYACGYVEGMPIGSDGTTLIDFVVAPGGALPEGAYLDVRAYEVVEEDVETIFKATVTDGVSDVTEITPTNINTKTDDGWEFSDQYTLRTGDEVTISGVTYIVASYTDNTACLYSNGEEYFLEKGKGLYKTGRRLDSYSTDTELISIDGVQYVITFRITSGNTETVYFATMDGKSAGHYSYDRGVIQAAYFFPDCTPEALAPKASDGGVVAVKSGQFLVNTSEGVKIASTVWANDISLHGANGLPVTGVSGTLTVSGIQYAATKATVAAHIGAKKVDIGGFDGSVFNIRDVDNFSPFILLEVADFEVPAIELAGITVLDEAPGEDAPATDPGTEEPGDDVSYGWIIAIIAAIVAVIGGGAAWVISRKKRRTH